MNWILISITQTAGSAPRGAGTQMRVFADHIEGTIGGGALEWQAMAHARKMLGNGTATDIETIPLGPALGQCCGGSVKLTYAANAMPDIAVTRDIWIYGAGHVGRAMAGVLAALPDTAVTLIDTSADRFPDALPDGVTQLIAADPALVVKHAPDKADHLIATYSHAIDLAICHAALSHRFASVGLIGSATKWARFRSRLQDLGHSAAHIDRIACPIGDPALGKHPMQIAIGVAAAMINHSADQSKERIA